MKAFFKVAHFLQRLGIIKRVIGIAFIGFIMYIEVIPDISFHLSKGEAPLLFLLLRS